MGLAFLKINGLFAHDDDGRGTVNGSIGDTEVHGAGGRTGATPSATDHRERDDASEHSQGRTRPLTFEFRRWSLEAHGFDGPVVLRCGHQLPPYVA